MMKIPVLMNNKKNQQAKPEVPYVQLTVSTWSKDSHALYDYEAVENRYHIETNPLKKSVKIYRHVTSMRTVFQDVQQKKELAMENIYVSSLIWKQQCKKYYVQSADASGVEPHPILKEQHPDLFKNSYLVLKDFQYKQGFQGYPLKTGTLLRLGRLEYLVLQMKNQQMVHTLRQTNHLNLNSNLTYEAKQQVEGTCKVCLCEQSTDDDPLINPCKCKGSCQFIHVGCLKNWINSKIKKQIVGVAITYNFSKFECQICKEILPQQIKLKSQKMINMISIQKPQKPYIMLQSYCDKDIKQQKKQRTLYLISPDEQTPIKMGRGHQCQIRLTDISVSRVHAEIAYQNGQFVVRDQKSKFGTLVKFREQFPLKDNIKLQYGRTCFDFRLIQNQQKSQQDIEQDIPVFYTRAQRRDMGQQLSDQDQY